MTMTAVGSETVAGLATTGRGPVLHVLYSGGLGGTEATCMTLATQLHREGWPQEIVFLDDAQGPARAWFHELPAGAIHACPYDSGRKVAFVLALARLVRHRRAHGLVVYPFGFHPLVALAGRLGGVRRVIACSGNPPPADARTRRLTRWRAQLGRPLVSHEVGCSEYVAEKMVEAYGLPRHRVVCVHTACDVEGVAREVGASRPERRDRTPAFGMVARFNEIKDHPTLIRAFARVLTDLPDARLVLIGEGPLRPAMQDLAADLGIAAAVRFAGLVPSVPRELGQLDVFVMATTPEEGFGVVLVEALSAGLPVIASDCGPCAEVLENGRSGLLVPPGDADALAAAMVRLWRDPSLRRRFSEVGPEAARERYSAAVMAAGYRTLLEA